MRLIDADAVIENALTDTEREYLKSIARHTPTIDAVPVIRCRDCKHRAEWNGAYGCDLDGCFGDRYTDGFCDRAERKDDETDRC